MAQSGVVRKMVCAAAARHRQAWAEGEFADAQTCLDREAGVAARQFGGLRSELLLRQGFAPAGPLPDGLERPAGVALLAIYALVRHPQGADLRAIAAVMGFGALGDVLIELLLEAGAGWPS